MEAIKEKIQPLSLKEFMALTSRDRSQCLEGSFNALHEMVKLHTGEEIGSLGFNRGIEAIRSNVSQQLSEIRRRAITNV